MQEKDLKELKVKLEWEYDNEMSRRVRAFNKKPPLVYGDSPLLKKVEQPVVNMGITQKSPIRFGPKR